jgi:hypothetical protein
MKTAFIEISDSPVNLAPHVRRQVSGARCQTPVPGRRHLEPDTRFIQAIQGEVNLQVDRWSK